MNQLVKSKKKNILTKELISQSANYSFQNWLGIMPNPDKVLAKSGKTMQSLRDLKNDAHLWSCIQSRRSRSLSIEYELIAENTNNNISQIIEYILNNLDLRQLYSDIFDAILMGFQPIEIMWDYLYIQSLGIDLFIPTKLVAKAQEYFYYDTEGNLNYKTNPLNAEPVPEYKILNPRNEPSFSNPYGSSLLSKCYWLITFKNGAMRFWVSFMERYGMPVLIGKFNRGATSEETEALADNLAQMGEDSVIVSPMDIDISLHEANKNSSTALYLDLINHCNAEISKLVLSQTLTTEISDNGSYAAAKVHNEIRQDIIDSDLSLIESTMNELITMIYQVNWGINPTMKYKVVK